ncbi:MAG: GDSL-type esterase/lipase family protein [Fibrobacteria bacterium]
MKWIFSLGLVVAFGSALHAQTINVRGRVSNAAGQPVANALVELVKLGVKDTTAANGDYSLIKPGVSNRSLAAAPRESIRLNQGILELSVSEPSPVKIEVFDMKGNNQKNESLPNAQPGVYHVNIANLPYTNQMLIVQASIGPMVRSFRYNSSRKAISEGDFTIASPRAAGGMLAKIAAAVDTLNVTAIGYAPKKLSLSAYDTTVNVTLDPDATTVYKPCPTNGNPCKILPFGDSITEGVNSTDGSGYRTQLFKLIVAANQKVTFVGSLTKGPTTVSGATFPRAHEGHSGWRIGSSGGSGIYSLIPSPALNDGPHIILLLIGANDVFVSGSDTMADRLDALLEKVAQNAPNALIVLAQMTPIGTSNNGHTAAQVASANAAQAAFNSKMPGIIQAHVAKGRHIIGVDLSKMPLSGLGKSTMHPNDQGYAYVAGIWYDGIKNLLPK